MLKKNIFETKEAVVLYFGNIMFKFMIGNSNTVLLLAKGEYKWK